MEFRTFGSFALNISGRNEQKKCIGWSNSNFLITKILSIIFKRIFHRTITTLKEYYDIDRYQTENVLHFTLAIYLKKKRGLEQQEFLCCRR